MFTEREGGYKLRGQLKFHGSLYTHNKRALSLVFMELNFGISNKRLDLRKSLNIRQFKTNIKTLSSQSIEI